MATKLHWHEALSLMVSYQVLSDDELEKPLKLVEELLAAGPLAQVLAGELANLIGRERAARYDPTLIRSDRLWGKLRHVLLAILIRGQSPITLAALRVRAGFAHSTLSYGDVATLAAGDMPLLPDARLPLSVLGASAASHPRWPDMLKRYWLPIEPGPFWFGDDRKGTLRQQSINTAYKVARFPITNADYARFMADQGYQNQHWWARQGWAFLQKRLITMPHYWQDAGYNSPTQPVVGVSWYESAAYCRWLTAQGHIQGWLPKADTIRLPTALEWERAARHTDKRVYPWGQAKPNLELANYATEIGSPSPVGCFPFGRALCGAEELAGNVWEWLVTPDQKDTQVKPIDDPAANEEVLFTGGWYGTDKIELMYCGARFGEFPGFRHFNHGFRIVWSLSSSDSV